MKQKILDLWHKNGTLSIINQMQIMIEEMKLPIMHKY